MTHKDLPVHSFENVKDFNSWLSKNYAKEGAFWLRYYKKGSGKPTILHTEAVDEALCWGWIDGLKNAYDYESYAIRFTPRRAKSVWSKINVEKVERLIKDERMQPSGLKLVADAKADGRWDAAYAGQATIQIPERFLELLKSDPPTWEFYQTLSKTNIYAIAYRIAITIGEDKKELKMQQLFKRLKARKTFHQV